MSIIKKNKFIDTSKIDYNKQHHYNIGEKNCITFENNNNNFESREKTLLKLKDKMDPYDYDLNYTNEIKKNNKEFTYFSPYNQGPGRGFGNLNIANDMRTGSSSRSETSDFKNFRESIVVDRFQYIDERYANPDNIVFPEARAGVNTRKIATSHNFIDYTNQFDLSINDKYKNINDKYKNINDTFDTINYDIKSLPNNDIKSLPNNELIDDIKSNNEKQRQNQLKHIQEQKIKYDNDKEISDKYFASFIQELKKQTVNNNTKKKNV
jgi:hypothetical protein